LILTSSKPPASITRTDVWAVKDGELEHVSGRYLGVGDSNFESALLVDNNRVLSGSKPVMWDLQAGFDIFRRNGKALQRHGHVALSPDRKLFANAYDKRIHLFTVEGSLKGALARAFDEPDVELGFSDVAFSPSGKFLAAQHGSHITIWELEKGKAVDQFPVAESGCLAWVNDRYIFSGGALYDRNLEAAVWQYVVAVENLIPLSDGRFLFADFEGVRVIELPEVDPDGARFGSLNPDRLKVIRAGQSISLDLSELTANGVPEVDTIRRIWEARLTNYGMKVQSGARGKRVIKFEVNRLRWETGRVQIGPLPLSGVISMYGDPSGKRKIFTAYRRPVDLNIGMTADPFDHPFFTDTENFVKRLKTSLERVRYRPTIGKIKMVVDGEVMWQSTHKFGPSQRIPMLLEDNESPQDQVSQACLPNPLFFASRFVPIKLSVVPENLVGESTISLDGIE